MLCLSLRIIISFLMLLFHHGLRTKTKTGIKFSRNHITNIMSSFSSRIHEEIFIDPSEVGIRKAARLLSEGLLVAFPTETVYGLGANALNEAAVLSIFTAKGRPQTDPLIVHVDSLVRAEELIDVNKQTLDVFQFLAKRFWPGPLTMIVNAAPIIPAAVTSGTGLVGIRCPNHPVAVSLLQNCGFPIAAPSANRFGHVSPTKAQHVFDDLGDRGVYILNGDKDTFSENTCEVGIESTVVRIDALVKKIVILRMGAITSSMIMDCLEKRPRSSEYEQESDSNWSIEVVHRAVKLVATEENNALRNSSADPTEGEDVCVGQEAPGQALTHYAPSIPCMVVSALEIAPSEEAVGMGPSDLENTVIVDFNGTLSSLSPYSLAYTDLSPNGDLTEAARQLFSKLRWTESVPGATNVLISSVIRTTTPSAGPEACSDVDGGLAFGVHDRMFRAASGKVLPVYFRMG